MKYEIQNPLYSFKQAGVNILFCERWITWEVWDFDTQFQDWLDEIWVLYENYEIEFDIEAYYMLLWYKYTIYKGI